MSGNQKAETRKQKRRVLALCLFCFLVSGFCFAKNGAYKSTAHARTSCVQCHDQQGTREDPCVGCHVNGDISRSAHAQSQCNDCHDPHGVRDTQGVIASMLADRPARLCVRCHDDIRSALSEPYVHAASCSDCHNAHKVIRDPAPSAADSSNNRLAGVTRVQVVNGGAGVAPVYRLIAADDPGDPLEYEVCFKCHSSYTKQRIGQTDLARLTNPANASFHPIQAAGRDTRIDPQSFVNGFGADSRVTCGDCHGPHGGSYRFLLKKSPDDVCFECHLRDAYTANAPGSRFNGHALHAGIQRVPCSACHDPHGSVRNGALIATGRFPGINTYIQTPAGGTCTSSCHGMQTYTVSYPR